MHHYLVLMPVLVRLVAFPIDVMVVPVMLFVNMRVTVLHWFMPMFVLMVFGQVQPHPPAHQSGGHPERERGRFAQQAEGQRRADEGRGGEVGDISPTSSLANGVLASNKAAARSAWIT